MSVCVYVHVPHCVRGGRRLTEGVSSVCLLVWQASQQVHYLLIHIAELRISNLKENNMLAELFMLDIINSCSLFPE